MAPDQSALLELLAQLKFTDVTDRIRSATDRLHQELIGAEATTVVGASLFERTSGRTTHHKGLRARTPAITAGAVLPSAAGASPPRRQGVVRCGDGRLCRRRLNSQVRRCSSPP